MTKAQRKRETILDPEQDKYVTSNYNRHAILQDVHPFTEDILQGAFWFTNSQSEIYTHQLKIQILLFLFWVDKIIHDPYY